jgi:hypothetical protein
MSDNQHEAGWRCPRCSLVRVETGGPDPCLGLLPGVKYACCGHGGLGYISFENGKVIRFNSLLTVEEWYNSEGVWEILVGEDFYFPKR